MNYAICSNMMDLEIVRQSGVSQTEKEKYSMTSLYVESKNK